MTSASVDRLSSAGKVNLDVSAAAAAETAVVETLLRGGGGGGVGNSSIRAGLGAAKVKDDDEDEAATEPICTMRRMALSTSRLELPLLVVSELVDRGFQFGIVVPIGPFVDDW